MHVVAPLAVTIIFSSYTLRREGWSAKFFDEFFFTALTSYSVSLILWLYP